MKLVIDIDELDYETIKVVEGLGGNWRTDIASRNMKAIANGTPLPKGHGRLIDANNITFSEFFDAGDYAQAMRGIYNAPTIIEADNAESEE